MPTWTCTACGFPIADGTGVIAAPYTEINDPPMFGIEWRPRHDQCLDDLQDAYWIPVEEMRDHAGVLRWTAHLHGKAWFANSSWADIIRSTLEVTA